MAITEEEFVDLVDRLLEVGVPPTAVAKAYGIDPVAVKDRQTELRVEKYGAAELAEAAANLQWLAFEQARAMIYDAPYNVRSRFIMAILSKTMSLTARQNPETVVGMRNDLMDLMYQVGMGGDGDLAGANPSAFIATAEADEDQEEGSQR